MQKERADTAERQMKALEPSMPTLTIRLPPGAPASTIVQRDGEELTHAALGVALGVDPGAHVVSARLPGGAAAEQRVTLERGERRVVVVVAPPSGTSGRRIAALAAGGVGIAGLTIGAITGALALGERGVVNDHCRDEGDRAVCDEAGVEAGDSLKGLGTVSTVSFAVGLVGVGVAVTLLVTEESDPGAGSAGGRRLVAGLGAIGSGAGVALRGSW
jgi:hypothetical protein